MKVAVPSKWADYIIRCPKLGHEVDFKYCTVENSGLPCLKILKCWKHIDGLEDWLKNSLGEPSFSNYFNQSFQKPKILSLVEIIERFNK